MSNKSMKLVVAVLLLLSCQLNASVIHSTWIGGEQGDWGTAFNWSPAIVPDNSETQTFTVTIVGDTNVDLNRNFTIGQMDCYGNVELGRGSEYVWDLVGLSILNQNGLSNYGSFSLDSQVMLHVEGNLNNPKGCTIDTAFNGGIEGDGKVENSGLITSCPSKGLEDDQLHNSGRIIVLGGACLIGELDNDVNGIINGFGTLVGYLSNKGKIYATGGDLTVATSDFLPNFGIIGNTPTTTLNVMIIGVELDGVSLDVNNCGTIEINASGGVSFDCNLVNEPNSVVKLLGGTLAAQFITQKAGATFEGFGGITGNLIIESNALIELTGPTNIVGNVTIEEGAILDISDGTVFVTGDLTCNGGTIQTYNGKIIIKGEEKGTGCNKISLY